MEPVKFQQLKFTEKQTLGVSGQRYTVEKGEKAYVEAGLARNYVNAYRFAVYTGNSKYVEDPETRLIKINSKKTGENKDEDTKLEAIEDLNVDEAVQKIEDGYYPDAFLENFEPERVTVEDAINEYLYN